MKQQPSRLKYKKYHRFAKSFQTLVEQKVFYPSFGYYAINVSRATHLTFRQIEACRKSVRRTMRKTGFIKLRVFTHQSVTKKSVGSRMGKGKGSHSH